MAHALFAATMVVNTLRTASTSASNSASNSALKSKRRRASREEPDGVVGNANIVAFTSAELGRAFGAVADQRSYRPHGLACCFQKPDDAARAGGRCEKKN